MTPRAVVLPLGLFVAACGDRVPPPMMANPPPIDAEPAPAPEELEPPMRNPPPPPPLPKWEEVPSTHPEGATNPRGPVLLMTKDGACYKAWVSPMIDAKYHVDRVTECPNPDEVVGDCGTPIECPPDAEQRTAPKPK